MKVIKKYGLSILLCLVILVLCFMNVSALPEAPMTDFDKVAHFVMFLGLSGVVFFDNTLYLKLRTSCRRIVLGSFLFPTLFSGVIELMQEHFTVNRSGDWMDFVFDAIGSSVGLAICLIINRRLGKEKTGIPR
ncbi:MAG: VanZ family protein [Dysgonamonadaceae bacterium]|nr:VanZ family protein [Dysgonamonadaceae bacterium]